jgi:hypothetical protein
MQKTLPFDPVGDFGWISLLLPLRRRREIGLPVQDGGRSSRAGEKESGKNAFSRPARNALSPDGRNVQFDGPHGYRSLSVQGRIGRAHGAPGRTHGRHIRGRRHGAAAHSIRRHTRAGSHLRGSVRSLPEVPPVAATATSASFSSSPRSSSASSIGAVRPFRARRPTCAPTSKRKSRNGKTS